MEIRSRWPLRAMVFAATCITVGLLWDISWHKTIGRDTFWTPAHLAIHLGGIVAGLTGAILIAWGCRRRWTGEW